MADHILIERYIGELRRETRWLRDAEEIAEEVADHLLEAVEKSIDRGLDRVAAQKSALRQFGDPALVGRAFASSRTGGAAMPTQFTKRAGYALITSAFLWIAGMAFGYASDVADRTQPWEGSPRTLFTIGAYVLIVGGLLSAAGVLGVNRRHGGSLGLMGRVAFWLFLVAGIAVFATWFWGLWLTALGAGSLLLGVAMSRSDIAPRSGGLLVASGGILAAVGVWSLQYVNTEISLSDWGVEIILYAGILLFAAGLVVLGRWLATEEIVDEPEPIATA